MVDNSKESPKPEPNPQNSITDDNSTNNLSDNQSDKKESDEKAAIANTPVNPDGVRFVVQCMAIPENIPLTDKRFKNIPDVNRYFEGGLWKYTAGKEKDLPSAKKIMQEIKAKYPDAFVIAFKGENKIPVSEAVKLLK